MLKNNTYRLSLLLLIVALLLPGLLFAQAVKTTYFADTEFELNIYRVDGAEPGPVMMVIGGIHNEPGSYLTVDQFVDITLKKGTLILVPRANFETIITDERGVSGDMNRMFHLQEERFENDIAFRIVQILKDFIGQSDFVLNMHDGSGFYRSVYIDDLHSPFRYGQSIIIDTAEFTRDENGSTVRYELLNIANRVCAAVNNDIQNSEHHFHTNNHDTFSPNTLHAEQQRSATYYALHKHLIPSFGVETSKEIRNYELRLRYQTQIMYAFMNEFGLERGVVNKPLEEPQLDFITASVNGGPPVLYKNGEEISINSGDSLLISHIEANFSRGLSVDIIDFGKVNDFGRPVPVFNSTSILIRKDSEEFGAVDIHVKSGTNGSSGAIASFPQVTDFLAEVNGYPVTLHRGESLEVVKGDVVRIIDTVPSVSGFDGLKVDFFGFVPRRSRNNDGNDLGFAVNTGTDLLENYSRFREGNEYQIRAEMNGALLANALIRLVEPKLEFLVIELEDGNKAYLENGDTYKLNRNMIAKVISLKTNIPNNRGVRVNVAGLSRSGSNDLETPFHTSRDLNGSFASSDDGTLFAVNILYRGSRIGQVFLKLPS